jgi:glycosyltransferase involved in cell wall biosynthesis
MPRTKIKICHIITRLDMGGSAQNTLLTCRELGRKYRIVLVHGLSRESNMTESEKSCVNRQVALAEAKGVKVIQLPALVRRISPANDIRALFDLFKIIAAEKPEIIHTHTSKAGILVRMAAALSRVPKIVHTPHGHVFFGHFGPVLSRIFLLIEKLCAHSTHRVVALTHGECKDYVDLNVYPKHKIAKIHSGVDIEKFKNCQVNRVDKKRSLGIQPTGPVVGFVGWLLPIKGPMFLLKAMDSVWLEVPDANLVFLGKGDLDVSLRSEALKTGKNGSVKFLGWRDDVEEIMLLFDIFVLPSLNEGMGRVLVEAMAAGKPVIASNVGGIPDLVKDGYNGLLVPPGDPEVLANNIMRLIQNPDEAQRMGQQGKKMCDRFGIDAMIAKLDHLYSELS